MSGPGTGYLGGWTSRDEERKTTSKWIDAGVQIDEKQKLGLVRWDDGKTTHLTDVAYLWKRCMLVEHILGIRDSEEIDVLYENIIGDE